MRNFLFVFIFCFTVGSGYSYTSFQEPPAPEKGGGDLAAPPPVGLPIDMGLSALLLSGLGLGIVFLKRKNSRFN